jgi:cytochrome c oxidase subunit 4
MSHDTHSESTAHAHGHSYKPYAVTLGALLMLTIITVAAAGINFGSSSVNVVIALTIATIKATLVALIFMHLKDDKPVNAVIAISGFLFLSLLLIFCILDIDNRDELKPGTLKVAPARPAAAAAPAADESGARQFAGEHK